MSAVPQPVEPKPEEPKPEEPKPEEAKPEEPKPEAAMAAAPEEAKIQVDFKVNENNGEHRTDQMSKSSLIVRRGQNFNIILKFKEPYNPGKALIFTAHRGEHSDETRGTKSVFGIPDKVKRPAGAIAVWKASLHPDPLVAGVTVTITPPAVTPIGVYMLSLKYSGEEQNLGMLAVLFNPWCKEDAVYMEKEKQKQEYVMNEHGVIYKGSGNYFLPSTWDYGQFENGMVEIALGLLHVSKDYLEDPGKADANSWDPIYVGRVISSMINSVGDWGVLTGKWGGPYTDGYAPTHWNGSYPILKLWRDQQCHPVKYGQCWVFAGVMCTVMRTLGIPSRVVSNYESAHDVDGNLTIDTYHAVSGATPRDSPDSVWNFHVWVESWMTRPDLPSGNDGWQVLDPTPQELSAGEYQCGPASVKAIKHGNTDQRYDVPFVFAEVNADRVDWLVYPDDSQVKFWSDTKSVGQNISTKSLGTDRRKDITSRYKFKEGTEEERFAFYKACMHDYSDNHYDVDSAESESDDEPEPPTTEPDKPKPELPEVFLKFEEVSIPKNGEDVKINLLLHSEATEPRKLSVDISVIAKSNYGTSRTIIQTDVKQHKLLPGKDLTVPVVVPFWKYWEPMRDNDVMKISAIVSDTQDREKVYLAELDVVLLDPAILIELMSEARKYQKLEMIITFKNPVSETLKDCTMTLSGSGLIIGEHEFRVKDVPPKGNLRVKLHFWPYKEGQRTWVVDFSCSVFRDIKKSFPILVEKF